MNFYEYYLSGKEKIETDAIVYDSIHLTYKNFILEINRQYKKIVNFQEKNFIIFNTNPIKTIVNLFALSKANKNVTLSNSSFLEDSNYSCLTSESYVIINNDDFIHVKKSSKYANKQLNSLNLLTSGTTGTPKICAIEDKIIQEKVNCLAKMFFKGYAHINEIVVFPVYSITALTSQIFPTLMKQGTLFIINQLSDIPYYTNEYNISYIGLTPSLFSLLLKKNKNILAPIKNIFIGGEPISFDEIKKASVCLKKTNIFVGYGLTEVGGAVACGNIQTLPRYSVGKILDGLICKIEKTNEKDHFGELYIKNEAKKSWIATGDIGFIEDEFLFIVDRKKNMIIISGRNIFPSKIRDKILTIADIEDVHVYGELNDTFGEIIIIDIITKLKNEKLLELLKKKLSIYEMPKKINYVSSIELMNSGKRRY